MKYTVLALILASVALFANVSFSIEKPSLAMTTKERKEIGYDRMTESQKKALDDFGQRYAVMVLNKFRQAAGI